MQSKSSVAVERETIWSVVHPFLKSLQGHASLAAPQAFNLVLSYCIDRIFIRIHRNVFGILHHLQCSLVSSAGKEGLCPGYSEALIQDPQAFQSELCSHASQCAKYIFSFLVSWSVLHLALFWFLKNKIWTVYRDVVAGCFLNVEDPRFCIASSFVPPFYPVSSKPGKVTILRSARAGSTVSPVNRLVSTIACAEPSRSLTAPWGVWSEAHKGLHVLSLLHWLLQRNVQHVSLCCSPPLGDCWDSVPEVLWASSWKFSSLEGACNPCVWYIIIARGLILCVHVS